MGFADDLDKLADDAVDDWPEFSRSGQLDAAIRDLYLRHLPLPPTWSVEECSDFVAEEADLAAQRLATCFDDAIDGVTDWFGRQYGYLPHSEDASAMIAASRRGSVDLVLDGLEYLKDELAHLAIHTAGRAAASMTGCSQGARRAHRARRPRRIGR
jgi:hypothetical protein